MLTLTKDVGVLFAAFIAFAYLCNEWQVLRDSNKVNSKIFRMICIVMSIAIPKSLWYCKIVLDDAKKLFSTKIDFVDFWGILRGSNNSYRADIWSDYFSALGSQGISLGNTNVMLNYYVLSLMLCILLIYIYYKKKTSKTKCNYSVAVWIGIEMVVYVVGICLSYMYKFSQEEAITLPSLQRYLNVFYLGLVLFLVEIYISVCQEWKKGTEIVSLVLLLSVLCVSPLEKVYICINRYAADDSKTVRQIYDVGDFSKKVLASCKDNGRIFFVDQEGKGYEYWLFKYLLRPHSFNPPLTWSIGENFYEGDIWTCNLTGESWKNMLIDGCYSYVVLYDVNEYFCESYGYLFDDKNKIDDYSLYYFDKIQQKLIRCDLEH